MLARPRRTSLFRVAHSSRAFRLRAVSQDLLVFGRKLAIAASFDFAFTGKRRHLAQSFERFVHFRAERRIGLRGGSPPVGPLGVGTPRGELRHPVITRRRVYPVNRENRPTLRNGRRIAVCIVRVARASRHWRSPQSRRRSVRIGLWLRAGI